MTWTSYTYTYIPALLDLPPLLHPAPLGHHRAGRWAPWTIGQLPTSCFSYICQPMKSWSVEAQLKAKARWGVGGHPRMEDGVWEPKVLWLQPYLPRKTSEEGSVWGCGCSRRLTISTSARELLRWSRDSSHRRLGLVFLESLYFSHLPHKPVLQNTHGMNKQTNK